jgi:hypothetical protein
MSEFIDPTGKSVENKRSGGNASAPPFLLNENLTHLAEPLEWLAHLAVNE